MTRGPKPKHDNLTLGLLLVAARNARVPWKKLEKLYGLERSQLRRIERAARALDVEIENYATSRAGDTRKRAGVALDDA